MWAALVGAAVAGASLAVPAVPTVPATAAAPPTVTARWQMNEAAGATVMHDGGPLGLDGSVDPAGVTSGFTFDGATGYHWDRRAPASPPVAPERIIQCRQPPPGRRGRHLHRRDPVPHEGELRQHHPEGPVSRARVASGRSRTPMGLPSCLFKSRSGSQGVRSKINTISDNEWHTITCV